MKKRKTKTRLDRTDLIAKPITKTNQSFCAFLSFDAMGFLVGLSNVVVFVGKKRWGSTSRKNVNTLTNSAVVTLLLRKFCPAYFVPG